jgi:hypothetical protein
MIGGYRPPVAGFGRREVAEISDTFAHAHCDDPMHARAEARIASSMRRALLWTWVLATAACGSERLTQNAPDGSMPSSDAQLPGPDATPSPDGDLSPDAGGAPDADASASGDASLDAGRSCDFSAMGAADKDRVVLLGHPFNAAGQDGTQIRSMTLPASGAIRDDGMRLDIGAKPARIAYVPSGDIALVVGSTGAVVSVRADRATDLSVIDRAALPSADYGDIVMAPDGSSAWIVGSNSDATSGISTVRISCDGRLSVDTAAFYAVRLSQSLVFSPDRARAILLGGQTTFAPVDPDDLRMLAISSTGAFSLMRGFDVYHDFIDAGRIGLSPDGRTLLVPNGSPFSSEGGQIAVIDVDFTGGSLVERRRLMNLDDVREAMFSHDGATALVTRFQPGKVEVLTDQGMGFVVSSEISGIGLADKMVEVARGMLTGRVLLPSVDPNAGPQIAMLQIHGPGMVTKLAAFPLGSGSTNIPDAIAVMP